MKGIIEKEVFEVNESPVSYFFGKAPFDLFLGKSEQVSKWVGEYSNNNIKKKFSA